MGAKATVDYLKKTYPEKNVIYAGNRKETLDVIKLLKKVHVEHHITVICPRCEKELAVMTF